MDKKGDKELQMIFGLFILLIISLVVLSLFFRFTSQTQGTLTKTADKYFAGAEVEEARNFCLTECNKINSENEAIEFCRKTVGIEAGSKGNRHEIYSFGKYLYCEDEIPCFLLVNCPDEASPLYTAAKCRELLLTTRLDYYANLSYDIHTGDCGLPLNTSLNNCSNWVWKFCYFNASAIAGIPGKTCPDSSCP